MPQNATSRNNPDGTIGRHRRILDRLPTHAKRDPAYKDSGEGYVDRLQAARDAALASAGVTWKQFEVVSRELLEELEDEFQWLDFNSQVAFCRLRLDGMSVTGIVHWALENNIQAVDPFDPLRFEETDTEPEFADWAKLRAFVGKERTVEVNLYDFLVTYDPEEGMVRLYRDTRYGSSAREVEEISLKGSAFDAARIMAIKAATHETGAIFEMTGVLGVAGNDLARWCTLENATFGAGRMPQGSRQQLSDFDAHRGTFVVHVDRMDAPRDFEGREQIVNQSGNQATYTIHGVEVSTGQRVCLTIGADQDGQRIKSMLSTTKDWSRIRITVDGYKSADCICAPEAGVLAISPSIRPHGKFVEQVFLKEILSSKSFTDASGESHLVVRTPAGWVQASGKVKVAELTCAIDPNANWSKVFGEWRTKIVSGEPDCRFMVHQTASMSAELPVPAAAPTWRRHDVSIGSL